MRNSNKTGSVAKPSIAVSCSFSTEDLMYVFSYKSKIEDLYKKLLLLYYRSSNDTHYESYTEFAKKNKIDLRLMGIMKGIGYCDTQGNWIIENPPRKADAVLLQLKIRDKYRESRT